MTRLAKLGMVAWVLLLSLVFMGSSVSLCGQPYYGSPDWYSMHTFIRPRVIPQWTPDGTQIMFIVGSYKGRDLTYSYESTYLVNADGSSIKLISKGIDDEHLVHRGHDISPDGSRVVYATSRHDRFQLETSKLDGSDRERLTDNEYIDVYPDWSPDGERIAFQRKGARVFENGIFVVNADGSDERMVTFPGSFGGLTGPVWSPDGQYLAYVTRISARVSLKTIRVDGSQRATEAVVAFASTRGRDDPDAITTPSWSPDSQYIAFGMSDDKEERSGIYIVRPDGTGLTKVAEEDGSSQVFWSPDGQEILSSDGFVVRPDGTGLRRVFSGSLLGLGGLSWSPDGSRIAVHTGSDRLVTIARNGTSPLYLAQRGAIDKTTLTDTSKETEPLDPGICSQDNVIPDPGANPVLVADCEILLRIRNALGTSVEFTWDEKSPITHWNAIRVAGSTPRITELHLPNRALTGSIPPELGELTGLRVLDLSNNILVGNIPSEIGELTSLVRLNLSRNQMTGGITPELGQLVEIQYMNLDWNRLGGQIPPQLRTLERVQHLGLGANQLTGPIPLEMQDVKFLRTLNLYGNELTGCVPTELPEIWVEESGLEPCATEAVNP